MCSSDLLEEGVEDGGAGERAVALEPGEHRDGLAADGGFGVGAGSMTSVGYAGT